MATHNETAADEHTFGRAGEQAAGGRVLSEVAAGRGGALFLEGRPGSGKTHMLREWANLARGRGLQVEMGGGRELEQDRPFGVLIDALRLIADSDDAERGAAGRRLTRQVTGDAGPFADQRYQGVDAIVSLVESWATLRPIVIVLDDLQWADASSLVTISRLLRLSAVLPVALIGACRQSPRRPELAAALLGADSSPTGRLALAPLDAEAVLGLVSHLAGGEPGPRLRAQAERCGGNPLFVQELVHALEREGLLERTSGRVDAAADGPPPSFSILVLRHLSLLPAPTLDLIRVASALGPSFALDHLALVVRRSVSDLLGGLRPALDAGILATTGAALSFQHDLVRDAIYDDLGPAFRAGLHREIAETLAAARRPAIEVAPHFASAASGPDPIAAGWLHRAGRDVASRDPAAAVHLLERAVEAAGPDEQRDLIQLSLGEALAAASRLTEAEATLRGRPLSSADAEVRVRARAALGQVLHLLARFGEASRELEAAAAEPSLPARLQARYFAHAVMDLAWSGDVEGAEGECGRALDRAEKSGDRLARFYAVMATMAIARAQGRLGQALVLGAEARRLVAEVGPQDEVSHYEMPPVTPLVDTDHFAEAERILSSAPAWLEERGGAVQPARHYMRMRCDFAQGRWDDATMEGETALALAAESGTTWNRDNVLAMMLAIAVRRDDLSAAERHARLLGRTPASADDIGPALALLMHALTSANRDGPPGLDRVAAPWLLGQEIGRELAPSAVQLLLLAGDRAAADRVTNRLEERAAAADAGSLDAAASLCRGMVDADGEALLMVVERFRSTPRAVDLACACEEAGRVTRSQQLLGEALDLYESFGARRDAARTIASLRGQGVRPGRRGLRRRPTTGWGSLTESELRVAELVAEGMLYREIAARLFISRRTVETHVVHLFGKLGLSSRVELARAVRQRFGQDL